MLHEGAAVVDVHAERFLAVDGFACVESQDCDGTMRDRWTGDVHDARVGIADRLHDAIRETDARISLARCLHCSGIWIPGICDLEAGMLRHPRQHLLAHPPETNHSRLVVHVPSVYWVPADRFGLVVMWRADRGRSALSLALIAAVMLPNSSST